MNSLNWEEELDAWTNKYEPMDNHIDTNAGDKFETYGEELEYVRKIHETEPNRVWTLVEGDSGNLWIVNGYHFVNRLNYFITAKAYENSEYVEIPYYIFDELDLEVLQEEDADEQGNTWYVFNHNQNEVFRNQWFNTEEEAQDYLEQVELEMSEATA